MIQEANLVTLLVIDVLEQLQIRYVIGGSLASSLHGIPRATRDADLLADVKPEHTTELYEKLKDKFYISEEAINGALRHRTSFSLIHLETLFKVDIFLPQNRSFDEQQFQNAEPRIITRNPERTAYFASAADTILAKLLWFRQGSDVSERQWNDVLGIYRIQADKLDLEYLQRLATQLGVLDLLTRLIDNQ